MELAIGTEFACALPGGFRVLLAEDDRLSASMVTDTLMTAGFGVHHVTDGLNALESIEREHFDLLITDWVMPRLNGLDLVEAIRERPHLNDLYVIFLSAIDDKEQLVRALWAGADDYLAKPFHSVELHVLLLLGLIVRFPWGQASSLAWCRPLCRVARILGLAFTRTDSRAVQQHSLVRPSGSRNG